MSAIYTCGRCGCAVTKHTHRCPECGVNLAGIRCTGCGFVGTASDFPADRCPKCGTIVLIDRDQSEADSSPGCAAPGCAGTALIVFSIIWGIATIGAFSNEPPAEKMTVRGAIISYILFVIPSFLFGWYLIRKSRKSES